MENTSSPRRNLNAIQHDSNVREFFEMNCDVCKIELSSLQHAKLHYLEHGISDGYIKCCDMKFREIKHVNDHLLYHVNPNIFRYSSHFSLILSNKHIYNDFSIFTEQMHHL